MKGNFSELYVDYPWDDPKSVEDLINSSDMVFQYTIINAITKRCHCLEGEEIKKCFNKFLIK